MACKDCGKNRVETTSAAGKEITLNGDEKTPLKGMFGTKNIEIVKRSFSMDLLDVLLNVNTVLNDYEKGRGLMRNSCLSCAMKHVTQSSILLSESEKGYPNHYWYALGHLAEAEDELVKDFSDLANSVREVRLGLEKDRSFKPDYDLLVSTIETKMNDKVL